MKHEVTEAEARLALSSIDRRRQQVIAEIDVPWWYWVGMAGGWVALGVLAEFGPGWATLVGTVLFGAVHAAIAPQVLSGRHGSPHLSVHGDLVSRRIPVLVIGFLIAMTIAHRGVGPDRQCRWRPARRPPGQRRGGRTRSRRRTELMAMVRRPRRAEPRRRVTPLNSTRSSTPVPGCRSWRSWPRPIGRTSRSCEIAWACPIRPCPSSSRSWKTPATSRSIGW